MTCYARPVSGFKCNYNRKGIKDVDDVRIEAAARALARDAWFEGFQAGWAEATDPGPFVNDVWDSKTPNPYAVEAS